MSTPHLTELLDLTDVVDAANRAQILEHLRLGARELGADDDLAKIERDTEASIDAALAGMQVREQQQLRTIALRIVYAGARGIAEQAYARAWDRARHLVDERTGEADDTLGTLDSIDTPLKPGYERELNPFTEGAVTV